MRNDWDRLGSTFNVHKEEEISPRAADNILLAWPPIVEHITRHFGDSPIEDMNALDYGCGTGAFTQKLQSLGFNATGTDVSIEMLKIADRSDSSDSIQYLHTDQIPPDSQYNLITGIMVFQFIEDIDEQFGQLTQYLNKGGLVYLCGIQSKVCHCMSPISSGVF